MMYGGIQIVILGLTFIGSVNLLPQDYNFGFNNFFQNEGRPPPLSLEGANTESFSNRNPVSSGSISDPSDFSDQSFNLANSPRFDTFNGPYKNRGQLISENVRRDHSRPKKNYQSLVSDRNKPAVAALISDHNRNKNKKNRGNGQKSRGRNGPKGKKRVGELKYEQYVLSIFPETEDVIEDMDLNGRELARPAQYPHMGVIGFRNTVLNKTEYKCGASLISYDFVVTTAHCTNSNGLSPTLIRFGDLNLSAIEEDVDPQTRRVARIINHPEYRDDLLYNDIALIQLAKPVVFTEFVRPIQLWYKDEIPFTHAFAMGFGAVQFAGAPTNRLTEFNLTIIPSDICNMILPRGPNEEHGIVDSQICALDFKKNGSDTFQGDSGGPLQVSFIGPKWGRQHNYLIGITSFGVVGETRYPGVYTKVSHYVDWIEQNVWTFDYFDRS